MKPRISDGGLDVILSPTSLDLIHHRIRSEFRRKTRPGWCPRWISLPSLPLSLIQWKELETTVLTDTWSPWDGTIPSDGYLLTGFALLLLSSFRCLFFLQSLSFFLSPSVDLPEVTLHRLTTTGRPSGRSRRA